MQEHKFFDDVDRYSYLKWRIVPISSVMIGYFWVWATFMKYWEIGSVIQKHIQWSLFTDIWFDHQITRSTPPQWTVFPWERNLAMLNLNRWSCKNISFWWCCSIFLLKMKKFQFQVLWLDAFLSKGNIYEILGNWQCYCSMFLYELR